MLLLLSNCSAAQHTLVVRYKSQSADE